MTTPEPVSSAPDTEALRQQVAEASYQAWQGSSPLSFAEQADDVRDEYLRAADALLPLIAEREAGLRADLDRTRADAIAWERAARAEVDSARIQIDSLSRMLRGMARRLGWMRSDCGDNLDAALGYKRERDEARAELARVSGDRTIPDDAAERQCNWSCPDDAVHDGLCPEHVQQSWATPTTGPAPAAADEVITSLYAALEKPHGALYAKLVDWLDEPLNRDSASSAADTAGSALYWFLRHGLGASGRVEWNPTGQVWKPATVQGYTGTGLVVIQLDENGERLSVDRKHLRPAAPQAPPDEESAREDTAPPDDGYNDDLTAGFLRAPVGACSCRPTAVAIHVPGTYCGDTQYEQAVDAMRATVGRSGDERDEEAVSAVLGYLADPPFVPQEGEKP